MDFAATIREGYGFDGPALELGRAVHEGVLVPEAAVRIPLAMMNRHGLVAGATGTGKTTTLQALAEGLSAAGVPVVVAGLKGDLSGLGAPGTPGGAAETRMTELRLPFAPAAEEPEPKPKRARRRREPAPVPTGGFEDFLTSREGKALQRKIARGLFGMLRKRL